MKKILFCITSLNGGGAERALANITLAMPEDVIIDILVNCEKSYSFPLTRDNVVLSDIKTLQYLFPVRIFAILDSSIKLMR